MDLLTAAAIELPCDECGGRRAVTLRQILASQRILFHEGCLAPQGERECPPAAFAPLVDGGLLDELERVWQQIEERAHVLGGELTVREVATTRKQ